jgi:hypothetical protein
MLEIVNRRRSDMIEYETALRGFKHIRETNVVRQKSPGRLEHNDYFRKTLSNQRRSM